MTEQAHSPLGPSAADRWINCPGSVNATRGIHDPSSEFAAEGNFAHDIAEMAREQDKPAKEFIGHKDTVDGFEFECTKDMAEHVQFFIDYVNQWECDENINEGRVSYDAWVDGGFGTLDAALLNDGLCVVADLKYGKGIQVFARDNSQLKLYALGIYQEYSDLYDIKEFKLAIVQPRLNHIDEWHISIEELLVWADEVVEPAADEAMTDTASFNAGEWCTKNFCKIRSSCKTRTEAVKASLAGEMDEIRDPNEMSEDDLGEAMASVPLIKKWCADIEARVSELVLAGHEIIGEDLEPYKMVAGRGSRAWKNDVEAEKALRNYKVKVADIWPRKLCTPPAIEKVIGKDHPVMKKHVVTRPGKPTLVPGSDPRPAYKTDSSEMDDLGDE
jgi:hypothetical protein